jgi:hypothetical protein
MISREAAVERYLGIQNTFLESYNAFYSLKEAADFSCLEKEEYELFRNYNVWLSWYYVIIDGRDKKDIYDKHNSEIGMGLFYDYPIKGISDKLFTILVNNANKNLTVSDYALLLYAYCEDENKQQSLSILPLSMLHDMLDPFAQHRFEAWLKA